LGAILNHRSTEPGTLRRAILAAIKWFAAPRRIPLFADATRIESVFSLAYAASGRFFPEFCRMNASIDAAKGKIGLFRCGETRRSAASNFFARGRRFCVLALALLFLTPQALPDKSDVISVPFRTAQSMILVDARVNDNRATLLVDTGANHTIVSGKAYGNAQFQVRNLHRNDRGPGMQGDALRLRANFALANRVWISHPVYVMNVDELSRRFGTPVDGLLGQDVLQEFRSVRINYKARVIELEQ
jgi:Aspartyl protease